MVQPLSMMTVAPRQVEGKGVGWCPAESEQEEVEGNEAALDWGARGCSGACSCAGTISSDERPQRASAQEEVQNRHEEGAWQKEEGQGVHHGEAGAEAQGDINRYPDAHSYPDEHGDTDPYLGPHVNAYGDGDQYTNQHAHDAPWCADAECSSQRERE
jgi:hypothetical protein